MSDDLTIAQADPDRDAADLGLLFAEMERHYYPDRSPDPTETAHKVRDTLKALPGCTMLLARIGPSPAGFATSTVLFPSGGAGTLLYVKDIYVAAAHRSAGIGARLLRAVAQQAVDLGITRVEWATGADNLDAIRFYEAVGARPMDPVAKFRLEGDDLRRVLRDS